MANKYLLSFVHLRLKDMHILLRGNLQEFARTNKTKCETKCLDVVPEDQLVQYYSKTN